MHDERKQKIENYWDSAYDILAALKPPENAKDLRDRVYVLEHLEKIRSSLEGDSSEKGAIQVIFGDGDKPEYYE